MADLSASLPKIIEAVLPWSGWLRFKKVFCLQEAEALLCVLGGYKCVDELVHDQEQKQWGPCTRTWKAGAIAYRCETCQVTGSSAICAKCYLAGGHKHHQSFSYTSPTGGCCDCGDLTGWQEAGCCPSHRPPVELQPPAMDFPLELALKLVFYTAFLRLKVILGAGPLTNLPAANRTPISQEACQIAQFVSRICAAAPIRSVAFTCIMGPMTDMFQVDVALEKWLDELNPEGTADRTLTGTGSNEYKNYKTYHWKHLESNMISVLAKDVFFCEDEEMLEELCVMVITLSYERALRRPYGISFLESYPALHQAIVKWAGHGLQLAASERLDRITAQIFNEPAVLVELAERYGLLDIYLKEMEYMLNYARESSELMGDDRCSYLYENGCQRVLLDLSTVVCHPDVAALLLGDSERVGLLCKALQKLHEAAPWKRAQRTHVEYEATSWRFTLDLEDAILVILLSQLLQVLAGQLPTGSGTEDCAPLPLGRRLELLHVATVEAISQAWDAFEDRPPQYQRSEIYSQLLAGAPVSIHFPLHHWTARLTCLLVATQGKSEVCTCEEEKERRRRQLDGQGHSDEDLEGLWHRAKKAPASLFSCRVHKSLSHPAYKKAWIDLAFHPLQTLVFFAQIRVGLWARNGEGMKKVPDRCCRAPASEHTLLPDLALLQIWFQVTSDEPDRALGELVSAFGGNFLLDAARRRLPCPPPYSFKVARTASGNAVAGETAEVSTPVGACTASRHHMPGESWTPGTPPPRTLARADDAMDDGEPPSPHSTRRPSAGALKRQADLAASLVPFMTAFPYLGDGKEVWDKDLQQQVPDEAQMAVIAAGLHTLVVLLRERSLWQQQNYKAVMKRDVIAWLAVKDMGFSDLAKLLLHTSPVEPLLTEVLAEVAEVIPANIQSNRHYRLRKEAWADFDPHFARYTPEQLNIALVRASANKWEPGWQQDPPGLPWPAVLEDVPKFLLTPLLHRLISVTLRVAIFQARKRVTHNMAVSAMCLLGATVEYLQQCHKSDKDVAASTSSLAGILEGWVGCGAGVLQLLQDITGCEEFNVEVRQRATKVREMVADIVIPLARTFGTPHAEHLARSISATPSFGDNAGTPDSHSRREEARRHQALAMEKMRRAQAQILVESSDSDDMEDSDAAEELAPDILRYDARRFGKVNGVCALCREGNEREALGWVGHVHVCAVPTFASSPSPCWQDIGPGAALPLDHVPRRMAPHMFSVATRCVTDAFPGLHLRCCGHLMHNSCAHAYRSPHEAHTPTASGDDTNSSVESMDILEEPAAPEGVERDEGEFLCPLCRRVSNAVLPALLPDPPDASAQPSSALDLRHSEGADVALHTGAEACRANGHPKPESPSAMDAAVVPPGTTGTPNRLIPMTLSAVILAACKSANDIAAANGLQLQSAGDRPAAVEGSSRPGAQPVQRRENSESNPLQELRKSRLGPAQNLATRFICSDLSTQIILLSGVWRPNAARAATYVDTDRHATLQQLHPDTDSSDQVDRVDDRDAEAATAVFADLHVTDMSASGRDDHAIMQTSPSEGTGSNPDVPVLRTGPAGTGRAEATDPDMRVAEPCGLAGSGDGVVLDSDSVLEPEGVDDDVAGDAGGYNIGGMDLGLALQRDSSGSSSAGVGSDLEHSEHFVKKADPGPSALWAALAHHVSHWEIVHRGTPPYAALSRTVSAGAMNWDSAPADLADWRAAANLAVLCQACGCGVSFKSAGFGLRVLANAVAWLGGKYVVVEGGPWIIISRACTSNSPTNPTVCQLPGRTLLDHLLGPTKQCHQLSEGGGNWAPLTGDPLALLLAMYSLALNDDSGWNTNGVDQWRPPDANHAFKAFLALVYHMAAAQALISTFAQIGGIPPLPEVAPLSTFYANAMAAFHDASHPAHTLLEQGTSASLLPFLRQATLLQNLFGIDAAPTTDWAVPGPELLCPLESDDSWPASARSLALGLGLPEPADALRAVAEYPDASSVEGHGLATPVTEHCTLEELLRRWLGWVRWEATQPTSLEHVDEAPPPAQGLGVGQADSSPPTQMVSVNQMWLDREAFGEALRLAVDTAPSLLQLPDMFQDLSIQCEDATCAQCRCVPPDKRALCLHCGATFCIGNLLCPQGQSNCMNHAIICGSGTALFLLLPLTKLVVVRGSRMRWLPSPYLDEHDEEDPMLKRGRPLHLVQARLARPAALWRAGALDFSLLHTDIPVADDLTLEAIN